MISSPIFPLSLPETSADFFFFFFFFFNFPSAVELPKYGCWPSKKEKNRWSELTILTNLELSQTPIQPARGFDSVHVDLNDNVLLIRIKAYRQEMLPDDVII